MEYGDHGNQQTYVACLGEGVKSDDNQQVYVNADESLSACRGEVDTKENEYCEA